MTDTLQNIAILMLCIGSIVHALGGNHGEHWYALDTLARMYEGLEQRVKEVERNAEGRGE